MITVKSHPSISLYIICAESRDSQLRQRTDSHSITLAITMKVTNTLLCCIFVATSASATQHLQGSSTESHHLWNTKDLFDEDVRA